MENDKFFAEQKTNAVQNAAERFEQKISDATYRDLSLPELMRLAFRCGAWYAIDDLDAELDTND